MSKTNYLSRAWGDLTREKGWYKSLILLGLAACVPFIGPIVVTGYLLDWGKEAAWGMDRGLPRRVGSVGRRLRYGLIALVIFAAWLLPILVVAALLTMIPGIGVLLNIVCLVAELVFFALSLVAVLRGLVYERIEPGLHFARIFKMAGHDTAHLAQAFAISAAAWLLALLISLLLNIVYAPVGALLAAGAASSLQTLSLLLGIGLVATLVAIIAYCLGTIIVTVLMAIAIRVYGYWLAQFEPAKWGTPKDKMPFEDEFAQAAEQATPVDPQVQPEEALDAGAEGTGEAASVQGEAAPADEAAPAPDAAAAQGEEASAAPGEAAPAPDVKAGEAASASADGADTAAGTAPDAPASDDAAADAPASDGKKD